MWRVRAAGLAVQLRLSHPTTRPTRTHRTTRPLMPPPDLQRIRLGLALVHWGFRLIAGAVVTAAALYAMSVLLACIDEKNSNIVFIAAMILPILTPVPIVIGILVGVIGRPFCLRTPPELPIARARIRLAVLLEACGLTTAVMFIPFAFMLRWATGVFPNEVVAYPVFAFSFVLFIAGRVFFLTYTTALANAVGMQFFHRPSVTMVLVIVAGSTLFAVACVLTGNYGRNPITYSHLLPAGIVFVLALCVFGTLNLYGRHLRRLREAVKRFNTPPAKEVALVLVQRPR